MCLYTLIAAIILSHNPLKNITKFQLNYPAHDQESLRKILSQQHSQAALLSLRQSIQRIRKEEREANVLEVRKLFDD